MSVVQEAGDLLFLSFQSVLPLAVGAQKTKKKVPFKTVEEGLAQFYAAARTQRAQKRLGVITRARIVFYLQQRLLDAGYAPELVRQVLFSLLMSAFTGRGN